MSPRDRARRVRDDHELSAALVAYLQRGRAASPQADIEAVRAVATGTDPEQLVARVRAVVSESLDVPVDRARRSLGDAGRAAAAEMARRHPELDPAALDALAWNFTFVWR